MDSIYLDFSKAFDQVDHNLLLLKLSLYGIGGQLHAWLASYLQDRTQTIALSSARSRSISVTSGVPQGSHLSPVLFLLFVNDMYSCIGSSNYLSYADDLKIFNSISTSSDSMLLQTDLNNILSWCNNNNMRLNLTKCHTITFLKGRSPLIFNYALNGTTLERVYQITDLGVIFDSQLTFVSHLDVIINRSLRLCGFIRRVCADFTDMLAIITLFNSLVRSILEYCSVIWSPYYAFHISRIENVQRKMINFVLYKLNIDKNRYDYHQRLNLLGIESLEFRRRLLSLRFGYQLVHGNMDCPQLLGNINFKVPAFNSRNNNTFHIPFHRTLYGQNNPLDRLLSNLNSLDEIAWYDWPLTSFISYVKRLNRESIAINSI